MDDDLIQSMTRAVKEEVVENYLNQRRSVEEQIAMIHEQALDVKRLERGFKKRLIRMYTLLMNREWILKFLDLAGIDHAAFDPDVMKNKPLKGVKFIRVSALTSKGKFKKLLLEAFSRLASWNADYAQAYEKLEKDCRAVNRNIDWFRQEFDLLTIINFLKSLDVVQMELKHYLGENFSPGELASVDQKLTIKNISFDSFELIKPPSLKPSAKMKNQLEDLATEVYEQRTRSVKRLMK